MKQKTIPSRTTYIHSQVVGVVALLFVLVLVFAATSAQADQTQKIERLAEQIKQLEVEIQELTLVTEQNTKGLEATSDAMEMSLSGSSAKQKTSFKGYGELHYNRINADSGSNKRQIDFHRFVLFVGHHFNDRLRLIFEVELEHSLAGAGQPGEVELEQAYVEYDLNQNHRLKGGLILVPVGLLNETHEPPTFYGVERNEVEKTIIPTTWWAGGVGYTFVAQNGLTVDLSVHEGLKIPVGDDDNVNTDARIRSGRQKTAEANADNFAFTGRIRYAAIAGLELAASFQYQSDVTQAKDDGISSATLVSLHAAYNSGPFGVRALYAMWNLDADSNTTGEAISAQGSNKQHGFYIEPSYRFGNDKVGVFARYEKVKGGRLRDRFNQLSLGANFWLYEKIVLKFDYVRRNHSQASHKDQNFDGINIGLGYYF